MTDRAAVPSMEQIACLRRLVRTVGADFVEELFEDLHAEGGDRLREMHVAFTDGDAERSGRAAHTLRSMSLTLGFARLGALCHEVETVARRGALAGITCLIGELEREFEAVAVARSTWQEWLEPSP